MTPIERAREVLAVEGRPSVERVAEAIVSAIVSAVAHQQMPSHIMGKDGCARPLLVEDWHQGFEQGYTQALIDQGVKGFHP